MPRGRILVAGKNDEFLAEARASLGATGYEVIAASDGEQACELVAEARPDGVIADLHLPGGGGLELCAQLRHRFEAVPCYVVVPTEDEILVERCLAAGARNVLVRPLKKSELQFAVRSLVNLRSLLRSRTQTVDEADRAPERALPPAGADPYARSHFFQFELFKRLLSMELKRAKRYGFPLSLMVVSPDGESAMSHEEGAVPVAGIDPETPTVVGRAVSQGIRDIDIPVRFSDDSVLVVMPHTDLDGAVVVGERIRRKARSGETSITVSIGVTSIDGVGRVSFERLVARASRAMLGARRDGGDRIVKG